MTLRSLVSGHRLSRAALICSATALAVTLGTGAAAFAEDGHPRSNDRRGSYRRGDDRGYRSDRGGYSRSDRGRGYYHRDPGYRSGDHYRSGDRYRYRDDYRGRSYHRDDRSYGYGRSYGGGYYDRRYDGHRFSVPRYIYRRSYRDYDRYFRGSVFYAPHHHHHRVYLFPVIIGGYTEYQPYAYCDDAFYPDQYGYGYDGYYDGYHRERGRFGLHFEF
jgi:hypothetical protein